MPCQDISIAGKGAGLGGDRSGLWTEYARIIRECQPRWVVIENVAALLGRGLDDVLRDLASIGYDAEWHCIPASAIGAHHRRDRIWIVAYPNGRGWRGQRDECCAIGSAGAGQSERGGANVPHPSSQRLSIGPGTIREWAYATTARGGCWDAQPGMGREAYGLSAGLDRVASWEGGTPRTVARGYPDRRHRLISLGNSVVPQIPELIGRAIMAEEGL